MKILVVVDMQKDFVDGALGTKEACAIVPFVKERIEKASAKGETVIFTRDTHEENYMETQEGHRLPVPHCIRGTAGWEIVEELKAYAEERQPVDKPTFGSVDLCSALQIVNEKAAAKQDNGQNDQKIIHNNSFRMHKWMTSKRQPLCACASVLYYLYYIRLRDLNNR